MKPRLLDLFCGGGHYVVPSAEGQRASFGLPPEERDAMLQKLSRELRAELNTLLRTRITTTESTKASTDYEA